MTEATSQEKSIIADARAIQERDGFCGAGWLKVIAPAKVNLFLDIGLKRPDGYHDLTTIFHSLNLHDTVYVRRMSPADEGFGSGLPIVSLVQKGEVDLPEVAPEDNLAYRAVVELSRELTRPAEDRELLVRIEKEIPAQAGLGGASTDAAAVLVAAANLWHAQQETEAIERVAASLGADVPFFLKGGCALYQGIGEDLVHELEPSKKPVVIVKPVVGVPTAQAYGAFDQDPVLVPDSLIDAARTATKADEVDLCNNLAPAAEQIVPELEEVRSWLLEQTGVQGVLLCGSGSATFAVCEGFSQACDIVAAARLLGWWARATSFCSIGATLLNPGDNR